LSPDGQTQEHRRVIAAYAKPGKGSKAARQTHGSQQERTAEGAPPGLAKHDKTPKGLEKKGKTPGGWLKGKAWWKKKSEQPGE
jgi:hypothetical protein